MISKAEFIRQATTLHPPAVKPKKKRVPITFWGCVGFVFLVLLTIISFSMWGEKEFVGFAGVSGILWIFFFFYYSAFLKKRQSGRQKFKTPAFWMDRVIIFALIVFAAGSFIFFQSVFPDMKTNFVSVLGICIAGSGCIFIWQKYSKNIKRQDKRYMLFLSTPICRLLGLLGIVFKKPQETVDFYAMYSHVFSFEMQTQNGSFEVRYGDLSRFWGMMKEQKTAFLPGGVEITLSADKNKAPLTKNQIQKIKAFFLSQTGQILLEYARPQHVREEITDFRHIAVLTDSQKVLPKTKASFFRGEYFYPTPEDLPVIYEDVAAFYQTIEEITHG